MPPYEKDFDTWNEEKKAIEALKYRQKYKVGDTWWCILGTNIGSEQDGTGNRHARPVLILKSINDRLCYVVPLTTSSKSDSYRIVIEKSNGKNISAVMSQIRVIDTKRLLRRMKSIDPCMFGYIREAARNLF